jgi:hypothetical protein
MKSSFVVMYCYQITIKSQITSTNFQINLKFKAPNSKPVQRAAQALAPRERLFFVWALEFW